MGAQVILNGDWAMQPGLTAVTPPSLFLEGMTAITRMYGHWGKKKKTLNFGELLDVRYELSLVPGRL